jgi:hypothetical protein
LEETPVTTTQVEYVGFRNNEKTRDYLLALRHPDGSYDQFVVAIAQEAFVSGRTRYQDGAEICFLKLSRALAAWTLAPDSGPPAARQEVTEADLLAYRQAHAPKPRVSRPPRAPRAHA